MTDNYTCFADQDLDDELYRKTGLRVEDIKQQKGRGRR